MDQSQWASLGLIPLSPVRLHELLQELLDRVGEVMANRERPVSLPSLGASMAPFGGGPARVVADDGRGGAYESSGLANLRHRAEKHGGTFTLETGADQGTRLEWAVPLR